MQLPYVIVLVASYILVMGRMLHPRGKARVLTYPDAGAAAAAPAAAKAPAAAADDDDDDDDDEDLDLFGELTPVTYHDIPPSSLSVLYVFHVPALRSAPAPVNALHIYRTAVDAVAG